MFGSVKTRFATIAATVVMSLGGFMAYSAGAATTAPAPGNLYGCITSTRTIANAYTTEKNFVAFLDAHGGKCPSGFPFAVTSGTASPTPTPTPTTPTPTPC